MNTFTLPITQASVQQQVELALRPRVMHRYLTHLHEPLRGEKHNSAACHVLDAKYEPDARCSILYQLGERLVIGELQWPKTELAMLDARAEMPPHQDALEMQVYPFEHDPALPGLTTVLDGQKMASILADSLRTAVGALPEGTRILRCQVTPLRYRLGKRCTLRFTLRLRDGVSGALSTRTFYGKLYHNAAKAQAVYQEMQMLSAAPALRAGQVEVAQAVAFEPTLPLVLQAPVSGVPLDLLLSQPKRAARAANPRTAAQIRLAAAGLAALHQVEGNSKRSRGVAAELERFQQRSERITHVAPAAGACLHELARALPRWLDCLSAWGAEITLVHGDCKPSQFFVSQAADGAEHIALLDFDHCGMADPASDVGNFLATLRQQAVGQSLTLKHGDRAATTAALHAWAYELEEQFLSAYLATRGCPPEFRWRARWYQAEALLRKALRSFARSMRSPLPALLVQEAWRCLALLPTI